MNVSIAQFRQTSTRSRDCRRFRHALRAELLELRALHDGNRARLDQRRAFLLTSKACIGVYKGNMGKLLMLPDVEIQPVIAAYAASERTEHFIGATTKPSGAAFRIIEGETPTAEVMAALEEAIARIDQALAHLYHEHDTPERTARWGAAQPPVQLDTHFVTTPRVHAA
jgi:hypothetical protein